jgi:uncharacterized protein (DUF2062 family)
MSRGNLIAAAVVGFLWGVLTKQLVKRWRLRRRAEELHAWRRGQQERNR